MKIRPVNPQDGGRAGTGQHFLDPLGEIRQDIALNARVALDPLLDLVQQRAHVRGLFDRQPHLCAIRSDGLDRTSTRLHSSHDQISYAVFCLNNKT